MYHTVQDVSRYSHKVKLIQSIINFVYLILYIVLYNNNNNIISNHKLGKVSKKNLFGLPACCCNWLSGNCRRDPVLLCSGIIKRRNKKRKTQSCLCCKRKDARCWERSICVHIHISFLRKLYYSVVKLVIFKDTYASVVSYILFTQDV